MKKKKTNFIKKMEKIPLEEFLIFQILESHKWVLEYQSLIDEWDNPKDVLVRCVVILRDTHKKYGRLAHFGLTRLLLKKGKKK